MVKSIREIDMTVIDEVLVPVLDGHLRVTTVSGPEPSITFCFINMTGHDGDDFQVRLRDDPCFRNSCRDSLLVAAQAGNAAARIALGYRRDEQPPESVFDIPTLMN
jgi:hypothetical protein